MAVNHPLAKNMIGAFHQPQLVLYDLLTLRTLPPQGGALRPGGGRQAWPDLGCRICELVRGQRGAARGSEPDALGYALYKGCSVKAAVVSQDERENGLRAILNLGHTIGHALEAVAGYGELLHGEAIAIGMIGSAMLGVELGASPEVYEVTRRALGRAGLPVSLPEHFDTDAVMSAMMHDKKFGEGSMVFVVPTAVGTVEIRGGIAPTELEPSWRG